MFTLVMETDGSSETFVTLLTEYMISQPNYGENLKSHICEYLLHFNVNINGGGGGGKT
jgi:hypothetical protein